MNLGMESNTIEDGFHHVKMKEGKPRSTAPSCPAKGARFAIDKNTASDVHRQQCDNHERTVDPKV